MKSVIKRLTVALVALGFVLSAAPVWAADVVVDDRKLGRILDDAVDAIEEIEDDAKKSDLRRRDMDDLERSLEKVEDAIKDALKGIERGKKHADGVIIDQRNTLKDLEDAIEELEDLEKDLKDMERDLDRKYDDVMDSAKQARKALKKAEDIVDDARPPKKASKEEPKKGPTAMTSSSFKALLGQVKGNAYDSEKVKLIKSASKGNHFNTDQVVALLKTFTYDADRAKAAIAIHPRVVDQGNWFKVYATFTYDSDKDKVRKAVGQ
ncbi:MAG: DUF4476 domain-containing protein [Myxococcota bacterium]